MKVVFDTKFRSIPITGSRPENPPENSSAKTGKNKTFLKNNVLPAAAIFGGGILVYFGLRGPNKNKIFDNAINQKLQQINNLTNNFKTAAAEKISKSFFGADKFIETYKNNFDYNFSKDIKKIKNAKNSDEVTESTQSAFKKLFELYSNENIRQGAAIFDKFLITADKEANFLRGTLWNERLQKRNACEEIVRFVFRDYNNPEKIEQGRAKLIQGKNLADREMATFQEKEIADIINEKSIILASEIDKSREKFLIAKRIIILSAFNKLKALGVKPLNPADILGPNDLFVKDLLNTANKDLPKMYGKLSLANNLADMKFYARIMKSEGLYDECEISRIEQLTKLLQKMAEEELSRICETDFSQLSAGEVKYKLHRINRISQKLGYPSAEQMYKHYKQADSGFEAYPAGEYIALIKKYPEIYYS